MKSSETFFTGTEVEAKTSLKALRAFLRIFLKLFKKRNANTKRDLQLQYVVRSRAWFFFTLVTTVRTLQFFVSSGAWFTEPKFCADEQITTDCIGPYNHELLDPLADVSRFLIKALLAVDWVLTILCYKRRHLSDYLLAMECF